MKSLTSKTLAVGLLAVSWNCASQAAVWGTETAISTLSPCPSFCGGPGSVFDFTIDGGEFVGSATSQLNNADGNGQARASLSGPDALPILGAEGFSGPDSRASSAAVGMTGYTYTGAQATAMSLNIILDGERGGTNVPGDAYVTSDVAVILGDVNDFVTHFATFIFEVVPGNPGLSILGTSSLSLDLNVGPQTKTDSIDFTLDPGDEFFVWAGLNAGGIRNGFGDAFDTLSLSFSDPVGIVPNVPVPAAVWLFGSVLALIGVRRSVTSQTAPLPASGR